MEAKHTATPWQAIEWTCHAKTTVVRVDGADTVVVAECTGFGRSSDEGEQDASFIVLACNAHEDLVNACNAVDADIERTGQVSAAAVDLVRAALAKAGAA